MSGEKHCKELMETVVNNCTSIWPGRRRLAKQSLEEYLRIKAREVYDEMKAEENAIEIYMNRDW